MPTLVNIKQLVRCLATGGQGGVQPISDACLAWEGERIVWVGSRQDLPDEYASDLLDAGGGTVVPGLVDCHTHLAFGGWRADEFEQRIRGRSYLEIARTGGGIMRTVAQTAALSEEQLFERCAGFLLEMRALGITSVECKSGYGLSPAEEIRTLRVYHRLAASQPVRLTPTYLAHVIPPERAGARERYVEEICSEVIPLVAEERLAEVCDVFVEETAFTVEEGRRIAAAAKDHGLKVKLHADQLSDGGGARLAAELGAVSADHLEMVSAEGMDLLAGAGVVAVSLPLATLYLQSRVAPVRRMIEAGVAVAVATDFNPGSAPSYHLPLAMMLACTLQRMTPAEAVKGATVFAAKALGRESDRGSLQPGKHADFAVIDAEDIIHWLYHFRGNACRATLIGGTQVAGLKLAPPKPYARETNRREACNERG